MGRKPKRLVHIFVAAVLSLVVPFGLFDSYAIAGVLSISIFCLILWLFELTPAFVPTLILWIIIPSILLPVDPKYSLSEVLRWAADPVLALFFGGFALGVAARRHHLDTAIAKWLFRKTGGSYISLLFGVIMSTAFLSMWISNIAAAALMLSCVRPLTDKMSVDSIFRRGLLLGIGFGANLGGMATPIGTGPNAIALSHLDKIQHITFLNWMSFAVPLTAGMLFLLFLLLKRRLGGADSNSNEVQTLSFNNEAIGHSISGSDMSQKAVVIVLIIAALFWIGEPLLHIPAAVTALAAAAGLFLSGLLQKEDLARIDWSTLLLISGGITLGRLLESSGILSVVATKIPFVELHPTLALFILCTASAGLSALMSNTATVVLLLPIATAILPEPSTSILIAISASFGMPFVISTPPNAMAYAEGGLRTSDLFVPGMILMVAGCLIVSLTGKTILSILGIP